MTKHLIVFLTALATLMFVFGVDAKPNCTKMRGGYKCVATDRDPANKFRGTIKNIYSSDITLDIISIVDTCERIQNPPPRGPRNSTEPRGPPRSRSVLLRQLDKDVKIPKGDDIPLEMERIKSPGYCSKTMIRNCRTATSARAECSQVISIS